MPIFILLSTLTQQGVQTLKSNPERLRQVNQDIEELGARGLRTSRLRSHVFRGVAGLVNMYCLFYAIGRLRLADRVADDLDGHLDAAGGESPVDGAEPAGAERGFE